MGTSELIGTILLVAALTAIIHAITTTGACQ